MTIEVKIIEDTYHPQVPSARITTFQVYAPRFLLAEINTHRVLAKSAASSRAIPVSKRIQSVRDDPFIPSAFGKNKRGMQSDENLMDMEAVVAEQAWRGGITTALFTAEALDLMGVHKQLANRVLEPYAHYYGVITATEWDNFWALRIGKAAQPEFQALASEMKRVYDANTPHATTNGWHIPYRNDYGQDLSVALKVSAARCARVSYKTFDGKITLPEDDLKLCAQLTEEFHMSPFDHPAQRDGIIQKQNGIMRVQRWFWANPEDHRQYWGHVPYRVQVEKSLGIVGRRSSFQPLAHDLVNIGKSV